MDQNLKKIKFKPLKTPRFLIGQVTKATADVDLKQFNQHRLRVIINIFNLSSNNECTFRYS